MALAVVIPYFQRTEGLLSRALLSIVAQVDVSDLRVIVVDDASPVPAGDEIVRFRAIAGDAIRALHLSVVVFQQPNAGPAAARNRGLDSLGPEISRVAFLDSDDVWTVRHLANAQRALDAGHDFYFSDLCQPGQTVSGFERAGRITVAEHCPIAGGKGLYAYCGDMFDQIISGNVIGTSTVVYDLKGLRAQRFDEAFFSAGEDYLFWIACARAGARFCFSAEVEAHYGYGVNVYAGSGWGTEGNLLRIQNEMRYRKRLLAFDLNPTQRSSMLQKIRTLRAEFAEAVLHRLAHGKHLPAKVLRAQWKLDPATIVALPIQGGQIVARRIRGEPLG